MSRGDDEPKKGEEGHPPHDLLDHRINHTTEENGGKENPHRKVSPEERLSVFIPSGRKTGHGCQSGASCGSKRPKPEKRGGHENPKKKGESPIQANETLEDRLPGQEGVTPDGVVEGILKEAGRKEKKKKGESIFSDEVGPPDELA